MLLDLASTLIYGRGEHHNWIRKSIFWGSSLLVEFLSTPIQTTTLFKCDWFDSSNRHLKMHPQYKIVERHSKKRYPAYDMFVFAHQTEQWAILKSRPWVFKVPVVEVAFQEDVSIAETLLAYPTWLILLEDVMMTLKRKIILLTMRWNGRSKTKTMNKKQNMNRIIISTLSFLLGRMTRRLDSAGTSTSTGLESEVRVGDVECSTVALDTSTTSTDAPAGPKQPIDVSPTTLQFMAMRV
ncbi:hypothetical protein M9H77_34006 [Catharanthus roseus]|uniref:Uncharacterized protein n=1 Tax=Catharanthus roseus TaxID=4058 RepID=A0ACB9ZL54_CATRO|nr:hypothetical protein M9H77_34006 [Catharanthus roseus]